MLAIALASAAVTDAIGVHPLFGAFLAGLCFPRVPQWQQALRTRLETILSLVLLPLFFAITGLRTRLDLLSDVSTWLWTGFVLLLAVVGKTGGAILGARFTGQDWRSSLALGALLNTRGLVELIVLNIAYNAHVFSPTLFTMLVVMALITTANDRTNSEVSRSFGRCETRKRAVGECLHHAIRSKALFAGTTACSL